MVVVMAREDREVIVAMAIVAPLHLVTGIACLRKEEVTASTTTIVVCLLQMMMIIHCVKCA